MSIEQKAWYQFLKDKVDQDVLTLKNEDGDYYWDNVDEKSMGYYLNQVVGKPWVNHLGLSLLCVTDRNLAPSSIYNLMSAINARLTDIFNEEKLTDMSDFGYPIVEKYLKGLILKEQTDRQKAIFLNAYNSFLFNVSKWTATKFNSTLQTVLSNYIFPRLPFDNRDFNVRTNAIDSAKRIRKDESSALTEVLPEVRAEAHFRWNQIKRLYTLVETLKEEVKQGKTKYPIKFSYEESDYTEERWNFILWDKESFCDKYSVGSSKENITFLEFIGADKIEDGSIGEGPWFIDILKYGLLGTWENNVSSSNQRQQIINYLRQWGYEEDQAPFVTRTPGLLTKVSL